MKKCDCYHITAKRHYIYDVVTGKSIPVEIKVGECWGTRECDECRCGGDRSKCDFYEDVRKEAVKPIKSKDENERLNVELKQARKETIKKFISEIEFHAISSRDGDGTEWYKISELGLKDIARERFGVEVE